MTSRFTVTQTTDLEVDPASEGSDWHGGSPSHHHAIGGHPVASHRSSGSASSADDAPAGAKPLRRHSSGPLMTSGSGEHSADIPTALLPKKVEKKGRFSVSVNADSPTKTFESAAGDAALSAAEVTDLVFKLPPANQPPPQGAPAASASTTPTPFKNDSSSPTRSATATPINHMSPPGAAPAAGEAAAVTATESSPVPMSGGLAKQQHGRFQVQPVAVTPRAGIPPAAANPPATAAAAAGAHEASSASVTAGSQKPPAASEATPAAAEQPRRASVSSPAAGFELNSRPGPFAELPAVRATAAVLPPAASAGGLALQNKQMKGRFSVTQVPETPPKFDNSAMAAGAGPGAGPSAGGGNTATGGLARAAAGFGDRRGSFPAVNANAPSADAGAPKPKGKTKVGFNLPDTEGAPAAPALAPAVVAAPEPAPAKPEETHKTGRFRVKKDVGNDVRSKPYLRRVQGAGKANFNPDEIITFKVHDSFITLDLVAAAAAATAAAAAAAAAATAAAAAAAAKPKPVTNLGGDGAAAAAAAAKPKPVTNLGGDGAASPNNLPAGAGPPAQSATAPHPVPAQGAAAAAGGLDRGTSPAHQGATNSDPKAGAPKAASAATPSHPPDTSDTLQKIKKDCTLLVTRNNHLTKRVESIEKMVNALKIENQSLREALLEGQTSFKDAILEGQKSMKASMDKQMEQLAANNSREMDARLKASEDSKRMLESILNALGKGNGGIPGAPPKHGTINPLNSGGSMSSFTSSDSGASLPPMGRGIVPTAVGGAAAAAVSGVGTAAAAAAAITTRDRSGSIPVDLLSASNQSVADLDPFSALANEAKAAGSGGDVGGSGSGAAAGRGSILDSIVPPNAAAGFPTPIATTAPASAFGNVANHAHGPLSGLAAAMPRRSQDGSAALGIQPSLGYGQVMQPGTTGMVPMHPQRQPQSMQQQMLQPQNLLQQQQQQQQQRQQTQQQQAQQQPFSVNWNAP